jgi:hypothetical protein
MFCAYEIAGADRAAMAATTALDNCFLGYMF